MSGLNLIFLSVLCVLQAQAALAAPSVPPPEKIPLVRLEKYDPAEKSDWRGPGPFFAGKFFQDTVLKTVANNFSETLEGKELEKYFPEKEEKKKIITRLLQNLKGFYESPGNETAVRALSAASDDLTATIIERILTVEGITDKARIAAWQNHLTAPMKGCLQRAKTFDQAELCVKSHGNDLKKNIGLAVTAELTAKKVLPSHPRKETDGKSIVLGAAATYSSCIVKQTADIEPCVLHAMRDAISKTADLTIRTKLASLPTKILAPIRRKEMAAADSCLAKAADELQIMACLDQLTYSVSTQASPHMITMHEALNKKLAKDQLPHYAEIGGDFFQDCMKRQLKALKKAGDLDSDKCSNQTENFIVYNLALADMLDAVKENTQEGREREELSEQIKENLDACWNNKAALNRREACLRENVIHTSTQVFLATVKHNATKKLQKSDFAGRMKKWESKLGGCLDKKLPKIIYTEENLKAKIYSCVAESSGAVAAAEIEMATEKYLDSSRAPIFGEEMAKIYFIPCLRSAGVVDKAAVDRCATNLLPIVTKSVVAEKLALEGKRNFQSAAALAGESRALIACVDAAKGDAQKINLCSFETQKKATEKILFHVVGKNAEEQLGKKRGATALLAPRKAFQDCVKKVPAPSALDLDKEDDAPDGVDRCMLAFIKEASDRIGTIKVESAVKPLVGQAGYAKMSGALNAELERYHGCIRAIDVYEPAKITLEVLLCGTRLETKAIAALRQHIREELSHSQATEKEKELHRLVALVIPCLDGLAGDSAADKEIDAVDPEGMLSGLLKIIGSYIRYDVEVAKKAVPEIFAELMEDLKLVGPTETRRKLVRSLADKGFLDQLMKALVRETLTEEFAKMPKADRLPKQVEDELLSKRNLDAVFAGPAGENLRRQIVKTILEPVLVEQQDMDSMPLKVAQEEIERAVGKALWDSPHFGRRMGPLYVQKSINEESPFIRFAISFLYGGDAKDWSKVRLTKKGQAAEEYIHAQILQPKFVGQSFSEKEESKRRAKAGDLVQEAMQEFAGRNRLPASGFEP